MKAYPLSLIAVKSYVTPHYDQSFPNIGKSCPRMSDHVIVPSTSVITIFWL